MNNMDKDNKTNKNEKILLDDDLKNVSGGKAYKVETQVCSSCGSKDVSWYMHTQDGKKLPMCNQCWEKYYCPFGSDEYKLPGT